MSKRMFLLTVAFLLATASTFAQAPDTLWSSIFGGNNEDISYYAAQTSDGGYIVIGETMSFGAGLNDYWLVKTDANGDSVWSQTYGIGDYDRCFDGMITADNGYIMVGWQGPYSSRDFWAVKTDALGAVQWNRRYGGYGGTNQEICNSVDQTADGGYIMAGVCNNDIYIPSGEFWLVKTDAAGVSIWTHAYGGSGADVCSSVQQAFDNGYILAGRTSSYGAGGYDMWLLKTNSNGDSIWSRTFGGAGEDMCDEVRQTADGGYILAGHTASFGAGGWDGYLVKTDVWGNAIWSRTYGGGADDEFHDVYQTSDGGYLLTGATQSYGSGSNDLWIFRVSATGDSVWSRTYGGSGIDYGMSVQPNADGTFIISGAVSGFGPGARNCWLLKLESEGCIAGPDTLLFAGDGPGYYNHRKMCIQLCYDHTYTVFVPMCRADHWPGAPFLYITPGCYDCDDFSMLNCTPADGWTVEDWYGIADPNGWITAITLPPAGTEGCACVDMEVWLEGWYWNGDCWLSVELLAFTAEPVNNGIQLEFSTASETNNDHFEIWKSQTESDDFVLLTQLESQGQSAMEQHYSYLDRDVANGQTYWYYLADVDLSGNRTEHRERIVSARAEVSHALPVEFSITNYPNPFNPETTIYYKIAESTPVTISIHNALGQLITILTAKEHSAGTYEIIWNAASLPSGIYLCRMQTSQIQKMIKLVMIK